MTQIISGGATHQLFLRSIEPMIRAIGSSLGPNGRATLFDLGGRVGQATSGVTIAREICGADGLPGIAQKLLRETLVSADRDLGDGTARLALVAEGSFRAGATYASGGLSAGKLADAMTAAREEIAEMIADEQCDAGDLEDIAMTAGADPDFAQILAGAFRGVGSSGVIEVIASRRTEIVTSKSAGFVFDGTSICSPMPTGEPLELDDVHIIAADDIISDFGVLAPVVEGFASKKKSLMIVARDVNGSALAMLERNRKAGILSVIVLKPSEAGPRAAELIEDLALATGAALVSERSGLTLSALKPRMLGRAARLHLSGGRAELLEPAGNRADIAVRAASLDADIQRYRYLSLDREHAARRKARLLGQWAVIRAGGHTEFETARLLATGRNALACLRSAAGSGVMPGGGDTLSRIARRLAARSGGDCEAAVGKIAAAGLLSIDHHLKNNSGQDNLSLLVGAQQSRQPAINKRPIYDPLRLTQLLVDQALSITTMLLRVDAAIVRRGAISL
jgi:chaperonin GroEL (HSP60 family)